MIGEHLSHYKIESELGRGGDSIDAQVKRVFLLRLLDFDG